VPFSEKVREEALVRSARCCCVCRNFAGRAVNVHHIIQEADGGPNDIENAIVLCLRCHSEAGHFNPRHPIGTKYSPAELARQRDQFWASVAAGQIVPAVCEVETAWKRSTPSDGDLHTYDLIVRFHNGATSVGRWKLQVGLPVYIPIDFVGLTRGAEAVRDNVRYTIIEVEGGSLFPGETLDAIGSGGSTLRYQMTHELYYASEGRPWVFWWRLFTDGGVPIEGSRPWSEMHIF
jgi:hypothetical protein